MNPYTSLAKKAVEAYVEKREVIKVSEDLPKEILERKSGIFVTIEKEIRGLSPSASKRALRGCIGTYLPTKENIAQEIIHNAVAAATEDYRFGPIQKTELAFLSYAVYILDTPELVKDIKTLDPKIYGIIVKTSPISYLRPKGEVCPKGAADGSEGAADGSEGAADGTDVVFNGHSVPKSALLLPDLEGIDTVEKQILIACQKGEIDPLKEKIIIYKFKVEKFSSENKND